jgi:hypothetical protein
MQRFLAGFVKRGLKAVGSEVIDWLREWTKPDNHGLVGGAVADATRSKAELMLENALLRQQLIVLERQVKRPKLSCGSGGSWCCWPANCGIGKAQCSLCSLIRYYDGIAMRSDWCGVTNHNPGSRVDAHRYQGVWYNSFGVWPAKIPCGEQSAFGVKCSS